MFRHLRLVELTATVDARHFGDAQGQARPALQAIVAVRDALTLALTQSDPAML